MTVVDPLSSGNITDVTSLRPSSAPNGLNLTVQSSNNYPYVDIDLNEPYTVGTTLNVTAIKLTGNVASVQIYIKEDSNGSWVFTSVLDVDPDTGVITFPMSWSSGPQNAIPINMIRIEPHTTFSIQDKYYIFKVYLIGCYPKGKL